MSMIPTHKIIQLQLVLYFRLQLVNFTEKVASLIKKVSYVGCYVYI